MPIGVALPGIDDDAIVRRQRPEHAHAGLARDDGAVDGARLDARRARLDAAAQ
jgi:hypothetical protein